MKNIQAIPFYTKNELHLETQKKINKLEWKKESEKAEREKVGTKKKKGWKRA